MARWYVLHGPHNERDDAAHTAEMMTLEGYDGIRVVRLRDRTGPSVEGRLATAEQRFSEHHDRLDALEAANADRRASVTAMFHDVSKACFERTIALEAAIGEPVCVGCGGNVGHHKAPDGGGCSGWFPTVREHLARLETEHAALVVRVGELERLPEPGPRMSDRAERERLFALRDRAACGCLFADCTKHGAFYYVTEADRLEAQAIAAEFAEPPAPDATRDPLTDPREGDWFVDDDGQVREVLGLEGHGIAYRISDDKHPSYMSLAAFVENRRKWRARAMTPAEVAAFKRDGTRPSAPTPIVRVPVESAGADGARLVQSEAEMAAELRREGWWQVAGVGWAPSETRGKPVSLADAHAAMRAAKGAR